jgi:zinc-binding alcohol dehydrogenase/oxidoreductase
MMKAILFDSPGSACKLIETEKPVPGQGEILVRILAASLNRRDYWIKKGIYQNSKFPLIGGSDGAGIIESVGEIAFESLLGKEIIINPGLNWGDNPLFHGPDFEILGLPRQGTFAEYICVPAESVWPKPTGWTFEKAASLPLAGLTAYRALFTRGQLKKGEKVFITGIGGGVAVFALKFALAMGAEVFVSSSSEKKIKRAIQLGASGGVNYKDPDWDIKLQEMSQTGFNLIIDSAAGDNFNLLPSLLQIGGRIVIFGGTAGKINDLTAAKIFWKQASILGTTMGSPVDFENMLKLVNEYQIDTEIDKILPMEDTEIAFKQMENHEQFGKLVIRIK